MSLPTAPRDISDHPKAGAVTDPVNKQQKDADVDRKVSLNCLLKHLFILTLVHFGWHN